LECFGHVLRHFAPWDLPSPHCQEARVQKVVRHPRQKLTGLRVQEVTRHHTSSPRFIIQPLVHHMTSPYNVLQKENWLGRPPCHHRPSPSVSTLRRRKQSKPSPTRMAKPPLNSSVPSSTITWKISLTLRSGRKPWPSSRPIQRPSPQKNSQLNT